MRAMKKLMIFVIVCLFIGKVFLQYKLSEKVKAEQGDVITSFDSPSLNTFGLAWDGFNLWTCDDNGFIYKHNPIDGEILSSIFVAGNNPLGITWDGTYLWRVDHNEKK